MSRHRPLVFLALFCVPAIAAGAATNYDHIAANIKTSTAPSTFGGAIDAVIAAEVAKLKSDDPAAQKSGRDQLVYEIESHNGTSATPQYQAFYAGRLAIALKPVAIPKNSLRVRLNAAILAAEIAGIAHRSGGAGVFSGLASTFLGDKDIPVVLWGMKLAKFAVADAAVAGANPGKLIDLVTKTIKAHPESGVIIEEGYATLTLEPYRQRQGQAVAAAVSKAAELVLPDLIEIIRWRTDLYRSGADAPANPLAEEKVDLFLPIQAFAAISADAKLKDRALSALGDLTCATLQVISNGNTSPEVIEVARQDGGALVVLGQELKSAPLQAAGQSIKEISASTPSAQLGLRCTNLAKAMKILGVTIQSPFGAMNGGGVASPDAPADQSPAPADATPVAGDGDK